MIRQEQKPFKHIIALMKSALCLLFVAIIIGLILTPITAIAGDSKRTVKIGYYETPGFQNYNKTTGEYSGYSYEYIQALNQYTNWNIEYVHVTFNQGLSMLKDGEIDLMNNVPKTSERKKNFDFSCYPAGSNYACIAVGDGNTRFAYDDFDSFDKLRVGLVKSSVFNAPFLKLFKEKGCSPTIEYFDTKEDVISAQRCGDIDARIITNTQCTDMQVISMFYPLDYYFATTKGNKELLSELNDAMMHIRIEMPELDKHLQDKYYSVSKSNILVLTEKEQDYIKQNNKITVACTNTWYPISYYKDGTCKGPMSQVYNLISNNTGLTFEYVKYDNYSDAVTDFSKGKVDMMCEAPYDFEYAGKYNASITSPISSISVYRVTNPNNRNANDGRKQTVAVLKSTYLSQLTKEYYATDNIKYIECDSIDECVDCVLKGNADITYINAYQATDYQSKGKYLPLQYYLMPEMQYQLCLAIANNRPTILNSIIEKSLKSIGTSEINDIFRKQVEQNENSDFAMLIYQHPAVAVVIVALVAAIFSISIFFHYYSRRIKNKNEELVRAKAAESSFLSRMSHDIRTPLNGIIGMTELAKAEPEGSKEIKNYLNNIDSSGKYLLDLVNNILDMSKIESGALELKAEPYKYDEFISYISAVINPICIAKDIDLQIHNIPHNITIITDKVRYNQIFVNLLSNAVKYTHCNGKIKFYTENLKIENSVLSLDTIVEDNGIGISEEFQEHMFDAFSQEDQKSAVAGTGLGLSIVKQLVDMMGGSIKVESKKGKGTKIIVNMNIAIAAQDDAKSNNQLNANDFSILKGKNIMICEDNDLNAEIAARMLRKQGVTTFVAKNGKDGIELFDDSEMFSIDAILMDVRMPVMDGIESTKGIRALKRPDAKIIPIIAMTADAYEEDIERTKIAGMDAHLSKPIDMMRLYTVLSHYINNGRNV